MFADDTSLHTDDTNVDELSYKMQCTVDELMTWTNLNHMALNAQKTKVMLVTSDQKRPFLPSKLPPIKIKNEIIEEVDSHLTLGVIIQNNLSWSMYLDELTNRISNKVNQLSIIKHFLDRRCRKLYFHAYIQSIIDYASTLWDEAYKIHLQPLTQVYSRAIKQVLMESSSLEPNDYKDIDILPLEQKLLLNKASLLHKIHYKNAPIRLINSFKENENRTYHNELNICSRPRTETYKKSLHFSGGVLWNLLPKSLKDVKDLKIFRLRYKQILFSEINQ